MIEAESRIWMAPDTQLYRLRIRDTTREEGLHVRRVRWLEFQSMNGLVLGTVVVPGFFESDLPHGGGVEELWKSARAR